MKDLGIFTISSGFIRATDPCYDRGSLCAFSFATKNGEWVASVDVRKSDWGDERVHSLLVRHVDYDFVPCGDGARTVGVDSGQFGFFDYDSYPIGEVDDAFYDSVSAMTLSDDQAGVIPFGAVCSSGYGDGSYPLQFAVVDHEAVAVRVVFIGPEVEAYEEKDQENA